MSETSPADQSTSQEVHPRHSPTNYLTVVPRNLPSCQELWLCFVVLRSSTLCCQNRAYIRFFFNAKTKWDRHGILYGLIVLGACTSWFEQQTQRSTFGWYNEDAESVDTKHIRVTASTRGTHRWRLFWRVSRNFRYTENVRVAWGGIVAWGFELSMVKSI